VALEVHGDDGAVGGRRRSTRRYLTAATLPRAATPRHCAATPVDARRALV